MRNVRILARERASQRDTLGFIASGEVIVSPKNVNNMHRLSGEVDPW